jgi:hypothetical protein
MSRPLQYSSYFACRETVFMFLEGQHINGLQPWMCDTAKKNVRSSRFLIKFLWISSPFLFSFPPPPSPPLFFATIDDLYLNILLALFFFSHFLALASTSLAHSVFYSSAFAHTAFCRNRESIIVHHAFSFHVRFSRTVKLFATHSHMYSRRKFLSTQADMYASRRASSAAMS